MEEPLEIRRLMRNKSKTTAVFSECSPELSSGGKANGRSDDTFDPTPRNFGELLGRHHANPVHGSPIATDCGGSTAAGHASAALRPAQRTDSIVFCGKKVDGMSPNLMLEAPA
jgi:hypothetical protein